VRYNYKQLFETFREQLITLSNAGKEICGRVIPVGDLQASNTDGIAQVLMANSQEKGNATNEQAVLLPLFSDIASGRSSTYIYKDNGTVTSILSTTLNETKTSDIKFPVNDFLLEVPTTIKKSDDFAWDVVAVKKAIVPVVVEGSTEPADKDCWIFCFIDTTNEYKSKWFVFIPKDEHIISDKDVINDDNFEKETMGKMMIQAIKLFSHISNNPEIVKVSYRETIGKKASPLIRASFHRNYVIE